MKLLRLFALLLILLSTPTTQAETPLVIDSAWVVANHNYLIDALSYTCKLERRTLEFPDEMNPEAQWFGATITDGKEIWTVITLPLKDGASSLKGFGADFLLRIKLRANIIVATACPDGSFKMLKNTSENEMILFSTSLDINDSKVQDLLNSHWQGLARKSNFAYIQYYTERTLLPTLPPEQEDESAFIRKVRQRSANDYQEGQYVGTVDSDFFGLYFEDHSAAIIWEQIGTEESSTASDTEPLPFQFGGFVNPDAHVGAAFRLEKKFIEKTPIVISVGMKIIPPEERDDPEKPRQFNASIGIVVSESEREDDDYHLIKGEGNIYVCYPKQAAHRPEEKGILNNEELDTINEELANTILDVSNKIRQSLLSCAPTQTADFAFSTDDEGSYYFACVYPSIKIEGDFAEQFTHFWIDYFQRIDLDLVEKLKGLDVQTEVVGIDEPENVAGITAWHRTLVNRSNFVLIGYAPERVYAVIRFSTNSNEVSDELIKEQFNAMQQRLVQMVSDSQQAFAENRVPPKTLFHSNVKGYNFRLNYEPLGQGFRYTWHVAEDSVETALALIASYGGDLLNQASPFLREK